MAKIIYDFYSGKDIYNDGSIEEKLLDLYKKKVLIDSNKNEYFYLTTDIRSNILNWYPFKKSDSVLEIGCGCGTITEMLTNNCGSVVSVDGSKRRAEITFYRHKEKENLEVYAGNFQDIKFNKKFNYIVVVGVFEYAKQFFDCLTPFDDFIKNMKNLLLPDGKVLLAIENRYGIKYWAGANEDHLLKPYIGLEGYNLYNVQTFGKKELIDMFNKYNFIKYKFYYPFPDYKLPSIIYTDERLPKSSEIASIPIYPYGNNINFNIHKTLNGLLKNNLFGEFSNSFLVEFGLEKSELSDVIYAKNSENRHLDYKIVTIETDKHNIYKIPCSNNSKNHLDNTIKIHDELKKDNIKVCDFNVNDGKYYSEKIEGISIVDYINSLAEEKKWNLIDTEIQKIVDFYYSLSEYDFFKNPITDKIKNVYSKKTYILKKSLIDGNISNIIRTGDNDYIFIDQEWLSDKQLPADYLIYFSLIYIFYTCKPFSEYISIDEYFEKYNINQQKISLFNEIERNFYKKVIDNKKEKNLLYCKAIDNSLNNYCVFYVDTGNGFNEENKFLCKYDFGQKENEYIINLELPLNTKRIRFDPIYPGNKLLYFTDLKVNNKKIKYESYNIESINNMNCLINNYPYIIFDYFEQYINISIIMIKLTSNDLIKSYLEYKLEKIDLENKEKKLLSQIDDLSEKNIDNLKKIENINMQLSNEYEIKHNLLEQIEILNQQLDNSKKENSILSNNLKIKNKEHNILLDDYAHFKKQIKELDLKNQKLINKCNNLKEKIRYDKIDINNLIIYCEKIEKKYKKTLRYKIINVIKKI